MEVASNSDVWAVSEPTSIDLEKLTQHTVHYAALKNKKKKTKLIPKLLFSKGLDTYFNIVGVLEQLFKGNPKWLP